MCFLANHRLKLSVVHTNRTGGKKKWLDSMQVKSHGTPHSGWQRLTGKTSWKNGGCGVFVTFFFPPVSNSLLCTNFLASHNSLYQILSVTSLIYFEPDSTGVHNNFSNIIIWLYFD